MRAISTAAGLALDELLGEPPARVHPVALFGRLMTRIERRLYGDSRARGSLHALGGVSLGLLAGRTLRSSAVACWLACAGRMLRRSALEIAEALERGETDRARLLLPALVGRRPDALDDAAIARAVVESLAENTVDAIVAPAVWTLVAGAPGALAHRATNTMDAMVGHRNARYRRYGWASARLDDAAAWLPARLTALLVATVRPRQARAVLRAVREDAPHHPSPNAGVGEAAFAAALGITLGGATDYGDRVEQRPLLGTGTQPTTADIRRAVTLSRQAELALALGLLGVGVTRALRRRR
ncbi:Cobalamin biosynthesis protein CobD/CbiB [Gaiella occulta]|uniref:Cobalamin biosynthesis protein CobD n=1 Tax=Gaiella occulta TaxID=1002870 RepID=A0A7M2YVX6_9ACTN|nr:adenosylcobinamide-phosphate synthase CbiB [Gaiella occulta]RDI73578.1 Cobalamin biosynthesis protein CobD/CbiB [Gaiella occulta]